MFSLEYETKLWLYSQSTDFAENWMEPNFDNTRRRERATHYQFCSNFCNEKASAISKYTNYSFGECALMMLGCIIGSKYMGECLEGWVVIVTYQGPSKHR